MKKNAIDHVDEQVDASAVEAQQSLMEKMVEDFAQKYKAIGGKTAEDVLDLAATVWEAGDELSPRQLRRFYEKVKLDPKGSTVAKLRAIGEQAERFRSHLDKIPNNWTSLYRLARLPEEGFNRLIDSGKLHAATTMNEIDEALGKRSSKANEDFMVLMKINVDTVREEDQPALAQGVSEFVRRYNAKVTAPGHAEDLEKLLAA